ncbi:3-deoxy-7-phosphoheptulonate synthase [Alkalibaculum sp. M08DMB]|uniref:3-deoxy-7-phosphoheptulonate synthase n=1 Tax=Alkalibaculum sporogenes TaxID=2655001 RepID=A0A6A7K7C9_9FIRM|nr:3-deoxy-7-phosphoheptulonate synthase [Alkalibaculum sporogenes]MPW25286.1 3-deoxy-7-phosphoheptulonate synthase [Alkalibaculum sporogenes]
MIIVVRADAEERDIKRLLNLIEKSGLQVNYSKGLDNLILGLIGDTRTLDVSSIESHEIVKKVLRVQEPYKKANRLFHPDNTVIDVNKNLIGGSNFGVIAGPCSVESEEQIISIARDVKKSGAKFLRGGAFKPRTSPYSFQGLGLDGLNLLKIARKETGLPIVSEIMSTEMIQAFNDDVDIIQVGARNMQNFILLRELGKLKKPILLKRGLSATIEELLMSAEYIMKEGNENVILCERGIRTFENMTRNTLDLSAIPILKKKSHLPVIVDPSHATGLWWLVEPMAKASIAAGADGLIIEVHNSPEDALCDGQQSLKPTVFDDLMYKLRSYAQIEGKVI